MKVPPVHIHSFGDLIYEGLINPPLCHSSILINKTEIQFLISVCLGRFHPCCSYPHDLKIPPLPSTHRGNAMSPVVLTYATRTEERDGTQANVEAMRTPHREIIILNQTQTLFAVSYFHLIVLLQYKISNAKPGRYQRSRRSRYESK